jgi:xanthine dehydrogenase YagT iron-sulfur-binding subunit
MGGGTESAVESLSVLYFEDASRPDPIEETSIDTMPLLVVVSLRVNGQPLRLEIEPGTSLLDLLRERLELMGTKKGCNQGACGACTVLLDGERVNACLILAVQCNDQDVTTVEGLASDDGLHPLQAAFIQHDGFQCGYCTPGQLCSAVGMLREFKAGMPSTVTAPGAEQPLWSDMELRERMSGNLCRCGAYNGIHDAIQSVFETESGAAHEPQRQPEEVA